MNSLEDLIKEAEQAAEKINGIIVEEMEEKATMCIGSVQAATPVKTGNLKRSITHSNIKQVPNGYSVTIGSSLAYAQAVEEGHKQNVGHYVSAIGKKLKKSFVPGKHMIRDNVQKYQPILEDSIKNRIEREV